jgi:pimeloyl-[acyl-carrier protein] synthase
VAGFETTTNLIGNGMLALLQNSAQLERLRENPDLLGNSIEELLRFDAPVQYTNRLALEDAEINGTPISKGSWVTLMLGAANRDPAQFAHPDSLELGREGVRPLSFGHGIHFCLGAPLARAEARYAFAGLLELGPTLKLGTGGFVHKPLLTLRGLEHLHLHL